MRLGLGIGISRQQRASGGGPPAFTPADLFLASEGGFWGEARTSDLWQDTARTTAVTAAGQPVASWRLYTASGVRYAEQATGARQPTYQVDGGGRGYISFDGTDDCLVVSALNMTASDELTVFGAIRRLNAIGTPKITLEFSADATSNNGTFFVCAPWLDEYTLQTRGTISQNFNVDAPAVPATGTFTFFSEITGPRLIAAVDGAFVTEGRPAPGMGTGNFGTHDLHIGARNGGAALAWNGWIYGLVVRGKLTEFPLMGGLDNWGKDLIGSSIPPSREVIAVGDSTVGPFPGTVTTLSLTPTTLTRRSIAVAGQTIAQQEAEFVGTLLFSATSDVIIQVGVNDLNPAEAASLAIARLQALVNTVASEVPTARIHISKMIPVRAGLIALYGGVNGPIAYQKWLDMNEAIAGAGPTPITGVFSRITAHETAMNDGSGNLAAIYDTGDGIHPNNTGRQVNADAWEDALLLP